MLPAELVPLAAQPVPVYHLPQRVQVQHGGGGGGGGGDRGGGCELQLHGGGGGGGHGDAVLQLALASLVQ